MDVEYWREQFRPLAGNIADDTGWVEMAMRLMRLSVSPGALSALRRMNAEIDIRGVLPTIRVPSSFSTAATIHRFRARSAVSLRSRSRGPSTANSKEMFTIHGTAITRL